MHEWRCTMSLQSTRSSSFSLALSDQNLVITRSDSQSVVTTVTTGQNSENPNEICDQQIQSKVVTTQEQTAIFTPTGVGKLIQAEDKSLIFLDNNQRLLLRPSSFCSPTCTMADASNTFVSIGSSEEPEHTPNLNTFPNSFPWMGPNLDNVLNMSTEMGCQASGNISSVGGQEVGYANNQMCIGGGNGVNLLNNRFFGQINNFCQTISNTDSEDYKDFVGADDDTLHNDNDAVSDVIGVDKDKATNGQIPEINDVSTEPMAYLQGLNSGNLMQFSQQSVLQDLLLQDIKPQANTLPTLESHNSGGYGFNILVKQPVKSHWLYSEMFNKIYVRMNKIFNVEVQFNMKLPIQPLKLRSFICFVKEVSEPVLRCYNHKSSDPDINNSILLESLLRCDNPRAEYCGSSTGRSIADRYSVLVPLNMNRQPNENVIRQTLAFRSVCQNSCIGRKETCLVFCLENMNGEILGQQVVYIKVCTCPKRDFNLEERNTANIKRTCLQNLVSNTNDSNGSDSKVPRLTQTPLHDENETNAENACANLSSKWEVSRTDKGNYRLVLECPDKDLLVQNIDGMIEKTATAILLNAEKPQYLLQHAQTLIYAKKNVQGLL